MELVYLWIKDLGIYREQGFHFSSKFRVDFSPHKQELHIDCKEESFLSHRMINSVEALPDNRNIRNLMLLVGDNGMGKTTLLKVLGLLNSEGNAEKHLRELCGNALIVYYDENQREVLYRYLSGEQLNANGNVQIREIQGLSMDIKYVYYSGIFANEIELINKKYDISTMTLLGEKKRSQFFYEEMNRQMHFYEKYISQNELRLDFLKKLFDKAATNRAAKVINVNMRKPAWTDSMAGRIRRSNEDRARDMYLWFLNQVHASGVANIRTHIMKSLLIMILQEIYVVDTGSQLDWKRQYPLIAKLIEIEVGCILKRKFTLFEGRGLCLFGPERVDEVNIQNIYMLYEALKPHYWKGDRNTQYFNPEYRSEEDICQSVMHALVQHMGDEDVIESWLMYLGHEGGIFDRRIQEYLEYAHTVKMDDRLGDYNKNVALSFDEAIDFYRRYHQVLGDNKYDFLSFNWRMSAGESAMLNFFARLEFVKDKLPENVMLLMDEPDLNLHPSLQQEFMEYLYQYINLWYSEKNVSIVIATHSPLLLSDIPKRNITFFSEDEEGRLQVIDWTNERFANMPETFGGNIHSLFYNSFFMKEGSIGAHARLLMEKLFNQLDGELEGRNFYHENELNEMIENIGEPILKKQAKMRLR